MTGEDKDWSYRLSLYYVTKKDTNIFECKTPRGLVNRITVVVTGTIRYYIRRGILELTGGGTLQMLSAVISTYQTMSSRAVWKVGRLVQRRGSPVPEASSLQRGPAWSLARETVRKFS